MCKALALATHAWAPAARRAVAPRVGPVAPVEPFQGCPRERAATLFCTLPAQSGAVFTLTVLVSADGPQNLRLCLR
jgi:hypothetical protein